jgi:pSer/pThr/pTyr-binding forkhead associated (FHA) protein
MLPVRTVSGKHAELSLGANEDEGRVFVKDLGSKFGTSINGRALRRGETYEIFPGDFVTFGDEHLARYEAVAVVKIIPRKDDNSKPKPNDSLEQMLDVIKAGAVAAEQVGSAVSSMASTAALAAEEQAKSMQQPERAKTRGEAKKLEKQEFEANEEEVVEMEVRRQREESVTAPDTVTAERVLLAPVGWSGPVIDLELGERVVLGTSQKRGGADVILSSPGVDKSHAAVTLAGDGVVYVEDLRSSGGTFVRGRQIKAGLQYSLAAGDEFMLGDSGCVFQLSSNVEDDEEFEYQDVLEVGAPIDTPIDTAALAPRPTAEVEIVEAQDVTLNAVNNDDSTVSSPWDVLGGGLKGMGDNLGAAIFNSKINVNYSYKPTITLAGGKLAGLSDMKAALLLALADTERGLRVDKERRKKIEQLVRALEAKNPTKSPLKSPLMNGRWALQYTTQLSVIGRGKPDFMRPKGAIFQTLDIFTLQCLNEETFEPLPFLKFTNASTFDLKARTDSRAAITPRDVRIAGVRIKAPPTTAGRALRNMEMEASGSGSMAWQDTTFVDTEMRISRTQSGDFFIFVRDDENDVDVNDPSMM